MSLHVQVEGTFVVGEVIAIAGWILGDLERHNVRLLLLLLSVWQKVRPNTNTSMGRSQSLPHWLCRLMLVVQGHVMIAVTSLRCRTRRPSSSTSDGRTQPLLQRSST